MNMRGTTTWDDGDSHFESNNVAASYIKKDEKILLQLDFVNGGRVYIATLRSTPVGDDCVTGTWISAGDTSNCSARIYSSSDESLVLYGTWRESGTTYRWFAHLSPT